MFASYYFYMSWKPEFAIWLVISTLAGYFFALMISNSKTKLQQRLFLGLSLAINLGMLAVFKYFNFLSGSVVDFLNLFSLKFSPLTLKLLLPLGISFFTFQSISYTVDVYWGRIKPEKHLGLFALYLSFFPRLVAGPIERAGNLLPQFLEKHYFDYGRVTDGLKLMAWGFLKKIVIADGLAYFVDRVFNNIYGYSGPALIIATLLYAVQIYCDFSGYTDIALGSAQVMGFKLMDNFLAPYSARSIADFWRRWHISLSGWFQDYVFNPLYFFIAKSKILAGRGAKLKHWLSFILAMLIGESLLGLWHGASWTFVFFGLYHGLAIIFYYLIKKWWDKLPTVLSVFLTFLVVSGGWIFFRASSLADVWYVFTHLLTASQYGYWHDIQGIFLHYEYEFLIIIIPIIVVILAQYFERKRGELVAFVNSCSWKWRWAIYYLLIMSILLFGSFGSKQFIYFNF